jgi:hypothetical protein
MHICVFHSRCPQYIQCIQNVPPLKCWRETEKSVLRDGNFIICAPPDVNGTGNWSWTSRQLNVHRQPVMLFVHDAPIWVMREVVQLRNPLTMIPDGQQFTNTCNVILWSAITERKGCGFPRANNSIYIDLIHYVNGASICLSCPFAGNFTTMSISRLYSAANK